MQCDGQELELERQGPTTGRPTLAGWFGLSGMGWEARLELGAA